jgi:hypothetical protein
MGMGMGMAPPQPLDDKGQKIPPWRIPENRLAELGHEGRVLRVEHLRGRRRTAGGTASGHAGRLGVRVPHGRARRDGHGPACWWWCWCWRCACWTGKFAQGQQALQILYMKVEERRLTSSRGSAKAGSFDPMGPGPHHGGGGGGYQGYPQQGCEFFVLTCSIAE